MEKLKVLQQACDLFKEGKFDRCQRQLEKCCDQQVTPLQWVLKNNYIVSKLYCQTCHKELQNELKNVLCQVRGIPPSRQVLPVELVLTFNYCLLRYKHYQCNVDLAGVKTIIDDINSTWLRVCRACDVTVLDTSTQDLLCCFVKALSCSMSDGDLIQPLLLLGCLQSVCHLTCGNIEDADCTLAVVNKNMAIINQKKNVHFRFLQNMPTCLGELTEIETSNMCDSINAVKMLHAIVHSVKTSNSKAVTSLVKSPLVTTSALYLSAWYWSMYSLYLEEQYSDVIKGVSPVVSGNNLSIRDRCIATNILACSLMEQNKLTSAITLLRQCLQDDFSFLLPLYNLSIMYGKQGRVPAKLESLHLLTMVLHQHNAAFVEPEPALVLQTTRRIGKPTIVVQNKIQSKPSRLLVYYTLARSCFDAGRFSDAADHYIDLLSALSDSTIITSCEMGEEELPSLVTIYFESALSQTKACRFSDALLIIKKLQEKLPHPPPYCAGDIQHPASLAGNVEAMAEEHGEGEGTFPGKKRQRVMSDQYAEPDSPDANDSFYSYVKISLLKVFCCVKCHQVEGALQCVDSVLKLLNKCQIIQKNEAPHSSNKKIKLDQGNMHAKSNSEDQSEHPILRLKAEAYNNKAIILIGQNKLEEASELLLNSIHCCAAFIDAVYNHTLLLLKLHNRLAASTNWLRFRYRNVTLDTTMVSNLLAKNTSLLKNARSGPSSSTPEGIPQFSLLMMDKFALEFRLKSNKK